MGEFGEAKKVVKKTSTKVMHFLKPIVHYGFIPAVIFVGTRLGASPPTLMDVFSVA